ncbi:MAG: hypothetical protein RIB60_09810 [Phycisphaerales bacterium]
MVRAVLGVIGGYLSVAMIVFTSFSLAFFAMGPDRAYQPGSYEVSTTWLAVSIVLTIIAALLGGWICALIAKPGSKAPLVLAGVVLVLGLVSAAFGMQMDDPGLRAEDVGVLEAMQESRQPVWLLFLNPVIGAVGVLLGAKLRKAPGAVPSDKPEARA